MSAFRVNDYVSVPTRGPSPDDNAMLGHGASVWKAGHKDGEPAAVAPNIYASACEACAQAGSLRPKLSDERILELWASNSGRPVTMGKARIIAQARAIEREILGGSEK